MKYKTASFLASVLLLIALADLPYGYYTFLRLVVCGVALYGVFVAAEEESQGWLVTLLIIALIFNPVIPVYLEREVWAPIDVVSAVAIAISGFRLEMPSKEQNLGA